MQQLQETLCICIYLFVIICSFIIYLSNKTLFDKHVILITILNDFLDLRAGNAYHTYHPILWLTGFWPFFPDPSGLDPVSSGTSESPDPDPTWPDPEPIPCLA